jgi:hypothetical protein
MVGVVYCGGAIGGDGLDPVTVLTTAAALDEREKRWVEELLKAARSRLKSGWTQGSMAKTMFRVPQAAPDADSVSFCVLGALKSAAAELSADVYTLRRAERLVAEAISGNEPAFDRHALRIAGWNDAAGRRKTEVIAVIDHALGRPPARRRTLFSRQRGSASRLAR